MTSSHCGEFQYRRINLIPGGNSRLQLALDQLPVTFLGGEPRSLYLSTDCVCRPIQHLLAASVSIAHPKPNQNTPPHPKKKKRKRSVDFDFESFFSGASFRAGQHGPSHPLPKNRDGEGGQMGLGAFFF